MLTFIFLNKKFEELLKIVFLFLNVGYLGKMLKNVDLSRNLNLRGKKKKQS